MKFLKFFRINIKTPVQKIAEKQLRVNISVIKSLQDYDAGKKEISTDRVKSHLRNI